MSIRGVFGSWNLNVPFSNLHTRHKLSLNSKYRLLPTSLYQPQIHTLTNGPNFPLQGTGFDHNVHDENWNLLIKSILFINMMVLASQWCAPKSHLYMVFIINIPFIDNETSNYSHKDGLRCCHYQSHSWRVILATIEAGLAAWASHWRAPMAA